MTYPLVVGALAFLLVVPWGDWATRLLLKHGIGKRIRVDGPSSHQAKAGTATMGGLYVLAGLSIVVVIVAAAGYTRMLVPLVAMLGFGGLGAYDDLQGLRDSSGVGWLARFKFTWQWLLAIGVALVLLLGRGGARSAALAWIDVPGLWVVPLSALLLVFLSNAVNITDGLDGLAGGTAAIAFAAYGVLCILGGQDDLAIFCGAVVGVLLAFLWFNVHPARMFMGDVGSEALGAGLAAVAVLSGYWLLLPLIGLVFVIEALSVMLQVGYFKYTRRKYGEGRRILRMSPLHHHFEMAGWSEVQVTLRFWILALVAGAVGVACGAVGS